MFRKAKTWLVIPALLLAAGCAAPVRPENLYKPDGDSLRRRAMETRVYETDDEDRLLGAAAQVLEDGGFLIFESERDLGLLTAAKSRETGIRPLKFAVGLLNALKGRKAVYDDTQQILATVVVSKAPAGGCGMRVEFARVTFNNFKAPTKSRRLLDPGLYRDFFGKVDKAAALDGRGI